MAISYPISFPTSPGANKVTMKPFSTVAVTRSIFTKQSQIFAHQGQLWQLSVSYPRMKNAEAQPILAALLSLNGMEGTFLFADPAMTQPRGTVLGTPVVNGGSQTGQTLNVSGFTPSATGVLLAGDYIQLGSGSTTRLYKVLKDVNADGSGNATLDIWPRLRESPANGASIVTSSPKGLFMLASNDMPWDADPEAYGITIDAIEAF